MSQEPERKAPNRKQLLHSLIQLRRQVERMISDLATDDDHRDYVAQIMAGAERSTPITRFEGVEPVEVVMERYGIADDPTDGHIPNWFTDRFGEHLD